MFRIKDLVGGFPLRIWEVGSLKEDFYKEFQVGLEIDDEEIDIPLGHGILNMANGWIKGWFTARNRYSL